MKKPKLRTIGKIAGIGGSIALETGIINTGDIMDRVKSTKMGSALPDVNGIANRATSGLQQKATNVLSQNVDTSQLMGDLNTDYSEQIEKLDQVNLSGVEALKSIFNNFM